MLREEDSVFSDKFNDNKEILKELNLTPSKKVRNQIAGYVSRIRKKELKKTQ